MSSLNLFTLVHTKHVNSVHKLFPMRQQLGKLACSFVEDYSTMFVLNTGVSENNYIMQSQDGTDIPHQTRYLSEWKIVVS